MKKRRSTPRASTPFSSVAPRGGSTRRTTIPNPLAEFESAAFGSGGQDEDWLAAAAMSVDEGTPGKIIGAENGRDGLPDGIETGRHETNRTAITDPAIGVALADLAASMDLGGTFAPGRQASTFTGVEERVADLGLEPWSLEFGDLGDQLPTAGVEVLAPLLNPAFSGAQDIEALARQDGFEQLAGLLAGSGPFADEDFDALGISPDLANSSGVVVGILDRDGIPVKWIPIRDFLHDPSIGVFKLQLAEPNNSLMAIEGLLVDIDADGKRQAAIVSNPGNPVGDEFWVEPDVLTPEAIERLRHAHTGPILEQYGALIDQVIPTQAVEPGTAGSQKDWQLLSASVMSFVRSEDPAAPDAVLVREARRVVESLVKIGWGSGFRIELSPGRRPWVVSNEHVVRGGDDMTVDSLGQNFDAAKSVWSRKDDVAFVDVPELEGATPHFNRSDMIAMGPEHVGKMGLHVGFPQRLAPGPMAVRRQINPPRSNIRHLNFGAEDVVTAGTPNQDRGMSGGALLVYDEVAQRLRYAGISSAQGGRTILSRGVGHVTHLADTLGDLESPLSKELEAEGRFSLTEY